MISYTAKPEVSELREAHRTLLVPSFRPAELLPESAFIAQFAERADALIARDDSGRMLGAAVVEHFVDSDLLQYLVIAPRARGSGVGSGLLTAVLSARAPSVSVLLAEFDRPDVQPAHPLHGDPAARLRFYARFGALALDLPYFQPPVSQNTGREHGMLLAVLDQDGRIGRHGALDPAQCAAVRHYLDEILDSADDADARRLRDAAAMPAGIRALALGRYPEISRSPL